MLIAGYRKTSLIDYPDHISTVVFTQGCNFRCPYCHNPELISLKPEDKDYMETDYFYEFLQERGHLLDGIVITGGEPTLQTDLIDFIRTIKSRGLKVKLDTNGFRFSIISRLIDQDLLDYLALDIKTTWDKYSQLTGIKDPEPVKKTVKLVLSADLDSEFRTTVVPGLHDIDVIEKIARNIAGARRYYIQNFRPDVTLDSKLQKKNQFAESILVQFKQKALKHVDQVEIRN